MTSPSRIHTVVVPGLLCSPRLYESVLPTLWTHGPTTIADTLSGDSIRGIAARLLASVQGPFALVGLSMGGYVALEVIRQAPKRVRALALLSTSARPDTAEQTASRLQQIELVGAGGFDQLVEAAFPIIVDAANAGDERLRATWRAMTGEVGPDAFVRQQRAIIGRADSRPLLPTITFPTLVLHGTGDQLINLEHGQELADGIPGARLQVLDRCGHSPTLERPDASARALSALLSAA